MKISVLLIFSMLFLFASCKKVDVEKGTPKCIIKMIRQNESKKYLGTFYRVSEWRVDGKVHYYFESGDNDGFHTLYTQDCEYICAPSGGRGGEVMAHALHLELLIKD